MAPPECGTRGGYDRHLRRGEVPCWPCVEANRARSNAQAQKRLDKALAQGRRSRAAAAAYDQVGRDIREVVHILATALGHGRQL